MSTAHVEIHPDVSALAFLLGTWTGSGRGSYPTIEPFTYGEELRFWHVGKPHLLYTQRTWSLDDGRPLHGEMGYWRPGGAGEVEAVFAYPTGHSEVAAGTVRDREIILASTSLAGTPTSKEVRSLHRTYRIDGDTLAYEIRMAAVGVPLSDHLTAELQRV